MANYFNAVTLQQQAQFRFLNLSSGPDSLVLICQVQHHQGMRSSAISSFHTKLGGHILSCCCFVLAGCDPGPGSTPVPIPTVAQPTSQKDVPNIDLSGVEHGLPLPPHSVQLIGTTATVRLTGEDFDGSGVIIHQKDDEVYILTVAHAVTERIECVDFFQSNSREPELTVHNVTVLSKQPRADLALLKVQVPIGFKSACVKISELGREKLLNKNEELPSTSLTAWSVGCGSGRAPALLREVIKAHGNYSIRTEKAVVSRHMWKTAEPQEGGRSGGPLLDDKGHLLGIALGKYEGYGFYAHLSEISKYFIDTHRESLLTYAEVSE